MNTYIYIIHTHTYTHAHLSYKLPLPKKFIYTQNIGKVFNLACFSQESKLLVVLLYIWLRLLLYNIKPITKTVGLIVIPPLCNLT